MREEQTLRFALQVVAASVEAPPAAVFTSAPEREEALPYLLRRALEGPFE